MNGSEQTSSLQEHDADNVCHVSSANRVRLATTHVDVLCLSVLSPPPAPPPLTTLCRARPVHAVTGLPCGATLIIAPTKEAAWQWSDRLESGVEGLSVLSYVMPLRERRRLSAKQAAAFDVVVTTYDVSAVGEKIAGPACVPCACVRVWMLMLQLYIAAMLFLFFIIERAHGKALGPNDVLCVV